MEVRRKTKRYEVFFGGSKYATHQVFWCERKSIRPLRQCSVISLLWFCRCKNCFFSTVQILIGIRPWVDTWVSRAISCLSDFWNRFYIFSQLNFHEISMKLIYFEIITLQRKPRCIKKLLSRVFLFHCAKKLAVSWHLC